MYFVIMLHIDKGCNGIRIRPVPPRFGRRGSVHAVTRRIRLFFYEWEKSLSFRAVSTTLYIIQGAVFA